MPQFQEFILNHPILWGLLALVLIVFAATELWRLLHGPRPLAASDAVRLINSSEAVIVDVRSASDFKKGHLLNAVNVPMAGVTERAREISRDKQRSILCYCAAGATAPQACAKLRKLGYTQVHALKGGINGWQSAGLPITRK
ncbi:MAG: rhodanese-like domain-containing protein [Salinisphaera sp.]|nr:rhodanese-like domain-containing protein [Salinisphaera sp.]